MPAALDAELREERRGGDERDRGHGAVGRGDGTGVVHVELSPQDEERPQGHEHRHEHRSSERPGDLGGEAALVQFDAALEPDGKQQVEREKLWQRLRNLQVGADDERQHLSLIHI